LKIPVADYKHLASLKTNARILNETLIGIDYIIAAAVPGRLIHRYEPWLLTREIYDKCLEAERE